MTTFTISDALADRVMAFASENESLDEVVARLLTEYLDDLEHIVGSENRTLAEVRMADYAAGLAKEDAA